jgi:phosphoribosyl-AMP cyclohydrolase
MNPLEDGPDLNLDFQKLLKVSKTGLPVLPVIVQNADTKEVLVLAYANREALDESLASGVACFWSTSRNELWIKGKTSGDFLDLVEVRVNCEQNSLLYLVKPRKEGVCHTRTPDGKTRKTCFYRKLEKGDLKFLDPKL